MSSDSITPERALSAVIGDDAISVQDLRGSAKIDVCDLVKECASLPWYYACACKMNGEARNRLRLAKAKLDLTKSELESAMRRDPKAFNLPEKVSESAISSAAPKEQLLIDAKLEVANAEASVDAASALVAIFEQKRSMLSSEVSMLTSQYQQASGGTARSTSVAFATEKAIGELRERRADSNS